MGMGTNGVIQGNFQGLSSFLCKFLEKILWGGEPPRLQNWSL